MLLAYSVIFSQERIDYIINGPLDNRINLVFFAEGYMEDERDQFEADMEKFFNAIIQFEPLSHYAHYFNVIGIWVPSDKSGLGGHFKSYQWPNIDRLLVVNNIMVVNAMTSLIPEADISVVIINTDQYGGSGGQIAVSSSGAPEIIAHEIGHSFAQLGDEYDYETPGQVSMEMPNVTSATSRKGIKWNYWIDEDTPVPTPEGLTYSKEVGLFEGAMYSKTGWYRPMMNCQMNTNGVPLCMVCSEQYIKQIYAEVSPIDSVITNNAAPFAVNADEEVIIQFEPMHLEFGRSLDIHWYIDDSEVTKNNTATLETFLPEGIHTIKAVVEDTTSFVRNDTEGLLSETVEWKVYVNPKGPIDCDDPTADNLIKNESFCHGLDDWESEARLVGKVVNSEFVIEVPKRGAAYGANLSHPVELKVESTYILSFRAKASVNKFIRSGMGLNQAPWDHFYENTALTKEWKEYSHILHTPISHENSRIFFDMGESVGTVYIDDVILFEIEPESSSEEISSSDNTSSYDMPSPETSSSDDVDITASSSSTTETSPIVSNYVEPYITINTNEIIITHSQSNTHAQLYRIDGTLEKTIYLKEHSTILLIEKLGLSSGAYFIQYHHERVPFFTLSQ